jgi:hypothetical protein
MRLGVLGLLLLGLAGFASSRAADPPQPRWEIGAPIVTYWAGPGFPAGGPPLTNAAAQQLADGGWNLIWCQESTLPLVARHGLRGLLTDPLLTPTSLDDPVKRAALEALVSRVQSQPAFYAYFLGDEPRAGRFPEIGRLVRFLREKDAAHLAYANLFPIGATNEQLGTTGDPVTAYQAYLNQFVLTVKPALLRSLSVPGGWRHPRLLPQTRPGASPGAGRGYSVPEHCPGLHLVPRVPRAE